MDSYDEFARRARLMTEVHALDETEENEEAGEDIGDKDDTGSAKVAADDAKKIANSSAEGLSTSTVFSGSDKGVDTATSAKSTTSVSSKSAKDKKRDAKKKSLKRL